MHLRDRRIELYLPEKIIVQLYVALHAQHDDGLRIVLGYVVVRTQAASRRTGERVGREDARNIDGPCFLGPYNVELIELALRPRLLERIAGCRKRGCRQRLVGIVVQVDARPFAIDGDIHDPD